MLYDPFYVIWLVYYLTPMALGVYLVIIWTCCMSDNSISFDVEYIGGPEDGHRAILVTKDAKSSPDEYLDSYTAAGTLHRYKKTERKTKEGFLVYAYAGSSKSAVKH